MVKEWEKRRFFLKGESKRKSNKEVIESTDPRYEFGGVKFTGDELIPARGWHNERAMQFNDKKIYEAVKERGGKSYNKMHTHPYYKVPPPNSNFSQLFLAFQSVPDLQDFLGEEKAKIMTIVQRSVDTGEPMGATMLFKNPGAGESYRPIPKRDERGNFYQDASKEYVHHKRTYWENPGKISVPETIDLIKKELVRGKIGIRLHPARGYYFNEETGNYEKKKDNLEGRTIAGLIGVGLMGSLFFFSFNLTGNAVSNFNAKDGNILGIIFFLVGLVGLLINTRRNK